MDSKNINKAKNGNPETITTEEEADDSLPNPSGKKLYGRS